MVARLGGDGDELLVAAEVIHQGRVALRGQGAGCPRFFHHHVFVVGGVLRRWLLSSLGKGGHRKPPISIRQVQRPKKVLKIFYSSWAFLLFGIGRNPPTPGRHHAARQHGGQLLRVSRRAHHLDDLQVLRLGFLRFQVFQLFLMFAIFSRVLVISWSMRSILFLAISITPILHKFVTSSSGRSP